jgi:hypothetical protein
MVKLLEYGSVWYVVICVLVGFLVLCAVTSYHSMTISKVIGGFGLSSTTGR